MSWESAFLLQLLPKGQVPNYLFVQFVDLYGYKQKSRAYPAARKHYGYTRHIRLACCHSRYDPFMGMLHWRCHDRHGCQASRDSTSAAVPDDADVPLRIGQTGFNLANDGIAAHEISIDSFRFHPALEAHQILHRLARSMAGRRLFNGAKLP
jgi:hypothetical protein